LAEGAAEVIATDVLSGPLERARRLGAHGTIQVGGLAHTNVIRADK
jgi:L-idonate 5-dehydrogenase